MGRLHPLRFALLRPSVRAVSCSSVKIMVPFLGDGVVRHLVFRGLKTGTIILISTHIPRRARVGRSKPSTQLPKPLFLWVPNSFYMGLYNEEPTEIMLMVVNGAT